MLVARVRPALTTAALLAALALAACEKPDNARGPGGVTVGEARALDDAAQMIEDHKPPEPAAPSGAPAPEAT